MQVVSEYRDGVSILALSGKLDATSTNVFDEASRVLLDSGTQKIVIDLEELEYVSSAGLRGVLNLVKSCRAASVMLAFCSMRPFVADVFSISGFSAMFPIYAAREEAIRAFL